ncbi:hypothetical protein [Streptomyces sp. NPDC051567]|uniref:hypothetical protein n=1 Tax=Streptomyces sp. NPDC051567 TaxID=3365660 RepID=UPI00379C9B61
MARPGTVLYPGLHRAINDLLGGDEARGIPRRTPEHVIARINRRWYGEHADTRAGADYRGCDRCTASGCKAPRRSPENEDGCDRIINRNSWLAAALLIQDCPDLGCEDGQIIGGGDCRACQQRATDRRDVARATAAAEERLRAETEALTAARAAVTTWEQEEADEEFRFRMLLGRAGRYGAMLDHEVQQHMTVWRERHPRPTAPVPPELRPTSPAVPPVRQDQPADEDHQDVAEEEPDYDGPDEDQADEEAAAWEVASRPSAEWLAWKARAAADRERKAAERLASR